MAYWIKKGDASRQSKGFTLVEMILAMAVGSIILAATYTAYDVVARQYNRVSSLTSIQESGIPIIRLLTRDLRMAGHKAVDTDMQSTYGRIDDPITITDSGNACCDSVAIIYDKALDERYRVTYYVQARANPTRNALYMDTEQWDSATSAWVDVNTASLVADYIDDFQLVGSDPDTNGDPRIVDISLIVRGRNQVGVDTTYTKPTYSVGNYTFSATDRFPRDEFSATINIRNLR